MLQPYRSIPLTTPDPLPLIKRWPNSARYGSVNVTRLVSGRILLHDRDTGQRMAFSVWEARSRGDVSPIMSQALRQFFSDFRTEAA